MTIRQARIAAYRQIVLALDGLLDKEQRPAVANEIRTVRYDIARRHQAALSADALERAHSRRKT